MGFVWGAATDPGDSGTFVGYREGLRTQRDLCGTQRDLCGAQQRAEDTVGLMWGAAGAWQSEPHVGHGKGPGAQRDPCGAQGGAWSAVGPVWGKRMG